MTWLTPLSRKLFHVPRAVRQAGDGLRTRRGWSGASWELLLGDRGGAEQQDAARGVLAVRDGAAWKRGAKECRADRSDDVLGRSNVRADPSSSAALCA